MRAYIATTGIVFGLVTLSHLARSVELWHRLSRDPWYVVGMCLLSLLSGGLSIWGGASSGCQGSAPRGRDCKMDAFLPYSHAQSWRKCKSRIQSARQGTLSCFVSTR